MPASTKLILLIVTSVVNFSRLSRLSEFFHKKGGLGKISGLF